MMSIAGGVIVIIVILAIVAWIEHNLRDTWPLE